MTSLQRWQFYFESLAREIVNNQKQKLSGLIINKVHLKYAGSNSDLAVMQ